MLDPHRVQTRPASKRGSSFWRDTPSHRAIEKMSPAMKKMNSILAIGLAALIAFGGAAFLRRSGADDQNIPVVSAGPFIKGIALLKLDEIFPIPQSELRMGGGRKITLAFYRQRVFLLVPCTLDCPPNREIPAQERPHARIGVVCFEAVALSSDRAGRPVEWDSSEPVRASWGCSQKRSMSLDVTWQRRDRTISRADAGTVDQG